MINRLTNVYTVQTGNGLRKLREDARDIIGEIKTEISNEQIMAEGGDEIDILASGQDISKWDTKLDTLNNGIDSIKDRAKVLTKKSKKKMS